MTLPISLTCKTQEPSRTRTLRGTRGTSTGEACGGGGREGGTERPPASAGPNCWTGRGGGVFSRCWSGRRSPPAGVLSPDHVSGVPWVTEGTILGPFWIKPVPQHACPGLEQAQPPGPHLPACLPLLPLHLSSLPPPQPRNPCFSGGCCVRRGCWGNGVSPFFLIPTTSTSLWPAGPVLLLSHGRGAPGGEGLG